MWRELILEAAGDAELGEPAGEEALAAVEAALGQPLPAESAALLRECDGVRGRSGDDVVRSAERIARDNAEFRAAADFAALYMPFEPLMFFGDNGGGDQFAFVRTPPRTEVLVWDHETDSRSLVCYGLAHYLGRALRETGDWYR
ncbi:SMI1/KNR4 family protein [Kitasatospora sp. NPDC085895]|uniref:SMI1/KNR4 family protein n=1 Tax=Kitasatospora sp. NPDC085895 TaxID=3155057 RepID=UPI00344CCB4E